jgi:hypothetical protein
MSPSIIDGLRTSSQALEENSRETTTNIARKASWKDKLCGLQPARRPPMTHVITGGITTNHIKVREIAVTNQVEAIYQTSK